MWAPDILIHIISVIILEIIDLKIKINLIKINNRKKIFV